MKMNMDTIKVTNIHKEVSAEEKEHIEQQLYNIFIKYCKKENIKYKKEKNN